HAGDERVAERGQAQRLGLAAADGVGDGFGERGDAGHVEGAGADLAFLAAAVEQGGARGVAAQQERAGAGGAAEFVSREGQGVGLAGGEVDGRVADGLDGVGVDGDAVGGGEGDDLVDGLEGADLVVRPHAGDGGDLGGAFVEQFGQGGDVDAAEFVDGEFGDVGALVVAEPGDGVGDG